MLTSVGFIRWRAKLLFFVVLCLQSVCFSDCAPEFACHPQTEHATYAFCNTSLPLNLRVKSLISLLTLDEKILQLSDNASGVPRLGIPPYEWWSESLHGVATNGPGVSFTKGPVTSATVFPQVIVMASSFDRNLWFSVASAIAVECRAMYNVRQAGLTFWAPNVNIFRDPRWGRGQETPGEDPFLTSAYAVAFVKGLQGARYRIKDEWHPVIGRRDLVEDDDEKGKLMLSACCKHLTAYDLENWSNFSRYSFNAVVTKQDLLDTYQPPFRDCVEKGDASCLMCSYNEVNGLPACASSDLLQNARTEWGFEGYITSDCDAVATISEYHHYTNSPEEAVALALKAGMDINCGTYVIRHTPSAINAGKVTEEDIDNALLNLFSVQIRLGLFDGDPTTGQFGHLSPDDVCKDEHRNLALEAAREGIVLLKNDNDFLPWSTNDVSSLVVIGPTANSSNSLGGGYSGYPCISLSSFEALNSYIEKVSYAPGCENTSCVSDEKFDEALNMASKAEFVILVVGIGLSEENEDHDRASLLLPGRQMDLVSSVASVSKKPIVLVLTGGGPLDVSFAKADERIASILWVGYPGEGGPQALAEIILGEYNPGGRLPVTWYPESFTRVPMNDMNMRSDASRGYPGRTYRFYTGNPVYGFGDGLSYTKFSYEFLLPPIRLSLSEALHSSFRRLRSTEELEKLNYVRVAKVASCQSLSFPVRARVTNSGDRDGWHVVLLFAKLAQALHGAPLKQLIGFERVLTRPHGKVVTEFWVDPCEHLVFANKQGDKILPLGDHVLMVGDVELPLTISI